MDFWPFDELHKTNVYILLLKVHSLISTYHKTNWVNKHCNLRAENCFSNLWGALPNIFPGYRYSESFCEW